MTSNREVEGGIKEIGINERIVYVIDVTKWGDNPSGVTVKGYGYYGSSGFIDNTESLFPTNSPTVSGNLITLSPIFPKKIGDDYYITIRFVCGQNLFETYMWVKVTL